MVGAAVIDWSAVAAIAGLYLLLYILGSRAAGRADRAGFAGMALAGRSLPLGLGVLTMTATWVGGGYVNGTAEATYGGGLWQAQAPWGYALSLVLGGLWFAPEMRRRGFTTMLDPFEQRYGREAAGLLYLPALTGELFWTAAILAALGTTFEVIAGIPFAPAVVLSAGVAVAYTARSGLWAVAVTDVVQMALLFTGLWLAAAVAVGEVGGAEAAWAAYSANDVARAPVARSWLAWWDSALLLVFGGIPWHVYFQRVLATTGAAAARRLSIWAGALSLLAAAPALAIGVIGTAVDWSALGVSDPEAAMILPLVLRHLTPPFVALLGLGALAAAVMSSVDSSILSASSMAAWNIYRPLVRPAATSAELTRVVRRVIVIVGCGATLIALNVQSVYALWFLCSDLVYCILFPQLVCALYDRRAHRVGAFAGYAVSLTLRLGAGEPLLGIPGLLTYGADGATGVATFPFRMFAMLSGLVAIVVVSRVVRPTASTAQSS
jgi:high affinity choline transporter 7